jgi:hypothetical protein
VITNDRRLELTVRNLLDIGWLEWAANLPQLIGADKLPKMNCNKYKLKCRQTMGNKYKSKCRQTMGNVDERV